MPGANRGQIQKGRGQTVELCEASRERGGKLWGQVVKFHEVFRIFNFPGQGANRGQSHGLAWITCAMYHGRPSQDGRDAGEHNLIRIVENCSSRPEVVRPGRKVFTIPKKPCPSSPRDKAAASQRPNSIQTLAGAFRAGLKVSQSSQK